MNDEEYKELLKWDEKLHNETKEYIQKLYGKKTRLIEVKYKNQKGSGFIKIDLKHE